jgi:protocatechuate 3,4-dioxygenase beta subunit
MATMDDDDRDIGRVLTRRNALALLGAAGYSLWLGRDSALGQGTGAGACVVRPAQTEGPYFVDELLNRSDLRGDPSDGTVRPGTPLEVALVVSGVSGNTCRPIPGAMVDLWQCDHLGVYSDVQDPSFNTKGKRFLRGYQVTDREGRARFTTVYPGWYAGRTVHIHFKIRSPRTRQPGYEFTSQFYFDDAVTDRIFKEAPYAGRGERSTRNPADGIFRRGGAQLILDVTRKDPGYAGTFHVALAGVD